MGMTASINSSYEILPSPLVSIALKSRIFASIIALDTIDSSYAMLLLKFSNSSGCKNPSIVASARIKCDSKFGLKSYSSAIAFNIKSDGILLLKTYSYF